MLGPITQVVDTFVPEIFSRYVMTQTAAKSAIIQSGAMVQDQALSTQLAGGGLLFNAPSFRDLDDDDANISADDAADMHVDPDPLKDSVPMKISTQNEMSVRLSRNQSWGVADLASRLSGENIMEAIGDRVAAYWQRQLQKAVIATLQGVFADNAAAPTGTEHVEDDLTNDLAFDGVGTPIAYSEGVTDFSAGAFLDTTLTMGDAMDGLTLMLVHSVVFNRMQKNNLITYITDSNAVQPFPTYMGRRVIIDDSMPSPDAGSYETWLFGSGALGFGSGQLAANQASEMFRHPYSGNGGGSYDLHSRVEWCIHPMGHKYAATPPTNGGPSNDATAGNLAHADSWERVYAERKQIKIARLITREHA